MVEDVEMINWMKIIIFLLSMVELGIMCECLCL